MGALAIQESEFAKLIDISRQSGNWNIVKSPLHKLAGLIVFRYHGTLFPSLVVEIVQHELDYTVHFDQPVSAGDSNFTTMTDPRIVGSITSSFGSSSFKLKGKSFHNVVDLHKLAEGLKIMSNMTKKDYSFVLKFLGRPCGKIVGSTQWSAFFPSLRPNSVLVIEVSPMTRMFMKMEYLSKKKKKSKNISPSHNLNILLIPHFSLVSYFLELCL